MDIRIAFGPALRLLLLLAFILPGQAARAQEVFATDSLVADFQYFVRLLEETHPDPYSHYGGRPLFRERVSETERKMRSDSISTSDELSRRINAFIAPLQDGHTSLDAPAHATGDRFAPIQFRVINDGITVRTLPIEHKALIGSRLTGIESLPIDTIYRLAAQWYAAENIIDRYASIYYHANQEALARRLMPGFSADSLSYRLRTPEGTDTVVRLPLLSREAFLQREKARQPRSGKLPTENLGYAFVDKEHRTMYFRSTSIMARDNIEFMRQAGMDFYPELAALYKASSQEMPTDTAQAIAGLSSFSEAFGQMLQQMKRHRSDNLIIDLRGNRGGWTPITLPTLYQLWGDEYLKKEMQTKSYRLVSPLYMKKMNTTLEAFNERYGTGYAFGDYICIEPQPKPSAVTPEYRAAFTDHCMSCVKEQLRAQQGTALYTPRNVYVVTDALTFSAAFHYAFYLWKMGAKVVGVASGQAPNTYMEQTPFELPRTRLSGSISNCMQLFLPTDDPRAKVFRPELPLTYDDLSRYGFDEQAEFLLLLDSMGEGMP